MSRASKRPARQGGAGSPVATVPHQTLSGTYTDEAVELMADEEGRAQFFTSTWGPGNREPRVVNAINLGAETSTNLIALEMAGSLGDQEEVLEKLHAEFPMAEDRALAAIGELQASGDSLAAVRDDCQRADLEVPEHDVRRRLAEISGLGLLGLGDLYFISVTFQVFGLSQAHFAFLPFSELQLVASSVMLALLLLTRICGHIVRQLGYLIEEREAERSVEDFDKRRFTRLTVRTWFAGIVAGAGTLAALGVLFGLSQVRASYLQQKGIDAHPFQFLLVQLGIAAAGFVLAYFMAHPLDNKWRSAVADDNSSAKNLEQVWTSLVTVVGSFNGLLRQREAGVIQHRDWALATNSDAARKDQLFPRRLQLSQPEPVEEQLMPNELPGPATPDLVDEVNRYLAGEASIIKFYWPLSLERVEKRLAEVDERRQRRGVQRHEFLGEVIAKARDQMLTPAGSNGKEHSF